MIKLSANLSKKVPLPDVDYSSQQFGAAMEVEADADTDRAVFERLQHVFKVLEHSVDAQIAAASRPKAPAAEKGKETDDPPQKRNGRATPAQVKAILAIARDRGVLRDELLDDVRARCGADRPEALTVKQASDLIGDLQRLTRV